MEVAGWFVGPIMEKIIKGCFDYLGDQIGWQLGMKKELERLRKNHPKIQAVVFAANQAQIFGDQNSGLNRWIWQLRDALDEVNDVLDELEYIKHEEQLPKNMEETKLKSVKKRIVKIGKRAFKRDPNLKRLVKAVQKLDKVSADVTAFLHLVDIAKKEHKEQEADFYRDRETGSLPTTNDLIGRGEAKDFVTQWLKKLSNEHGDRNNISLLSIVGHGGMGKTTLSQHVYKDEEITKLFDLQMWVCVSNNFDVKKVIADMLECLKKERPRLDVSLDALQNGLKNEVMSKKFLLILDDIWEEEENRDISKWEKVLAPLSYASLGSKILVTTRMESVAMKIANVNKTKKEIYKLSGLKEDECLQLLNSHAFAGVENPSDGHNKLRAIAGEISKKLLGSPLAAKVIGGVLSSKLDERHWRTVLESSLLGQNSVDSILRLSYIVLSNPLKSCFAFCCLFAQDHQYDKDDLLRMWIALGFIQPSQGITLEDIGKRYFEDLVKKTLLEEVGYDVYKMHDLIHESASKFFAQEYGKLVDDEESSVKISETIRHLSVQTTNRDIIKKIEQFKYLHSLMLFDETYNQDISNALFEICKASRSLRLLYIYGPHMEIIPEQIGKLIHLRYLKFTLSGSTMLPRSLSNLYHLQYIISDCLDIREEVKFHDSLPSDINNLSNLHYMKVHGNFISSIYGIGKLKSLQELKKFNFRDVSGYRIGELENMNDLYKLAINCLENVKDAEEACSAKLCEKRRLTNLTLSWSWNSTDSRNIDLDENVLDNLLPPKCLKNLSIERYMGARSAVWMNNVNPIFNVEKIELRHCLEWETLPPFSQLPFLKSLGLHNMPKVKWLESKFNGNDKYRAFPLLEELYIKELEALEDWFEAGVAAEDGCFFPCLIRLRIDNCPKLKELPSFPSKLKILHINKIGWTTLNFCSNSNPIPLESLDVSDCTDITFLPLADEIARLAALRHLGIIKCPNLISLGEMSNTNNCHLMLGHLGISDPLVLLMEPLRSIASLKKLGIVGNDEVVSIPNEVEPWFLKVRPSLSELEFSHLKSLPSLPSFLESLSSLQVLRIEGVPMLRELPNLPPSLKNLYIFGCPPELKERYRYREDGSSDWHKIAHIPDIWFI